MGSNEYKKLYTDQHQATQAQVLLAISESKENVDASVTLVGQGVLLDQPLITF